MQSDSEYQPSRKYDSEIDSWDEEQKALTGHRCRNGFNLRSEFDDERRGAAYYLDEGRSSEHSFNSGKMIDGYKDFLIESQKLVTITQEESTKKKKRVRTKHVRRKIDGEEELTKVSSCSSLSLTAKNDGLLKNKNEDEQAEFDLNISFSGGYVPNTDLSRVDKGQSNPQF